MRVAALLLLAIPPFQDGSPLGFTPPPDRYDPEHDAWLFEAWNGPACFAGPFDAKLTAQPPPLRPTAWTVLDGDGFLRQFVIEPYEGPPVESLGRAETMPEDGELCGSFAHAFTRLTVPRDEVLFLRAPGAELVFVNGDGFVGDPERRGWLGVPVALRQGENEIIVTGVHGGFEVTLWKPVSRLVMASWAVAVSGFLDFELEEWPDLSAELNVPVFNASAAPAEAIHFHYDHAQAAETLPGLAEWRDRGYAAPLGIVPKASFLFGSDEVPSGPIPDLLVPLAAFDAADAHGERRLLLLRGDEPPPTWPTRVAPRWPTPPARDTKARITLGPTLVIESSGDEAFDREALAVARFCQQRLWERGGVLLPLHTEQYLDEFYELNPGILPYGTLIRFGRLDEGAGPGVLWAGPEEEESKDGPAAFAVRGSDPTGMRLVYAIEPFFREIGPDGKSWSVR